MDFLQTIFKTNIFSGAPKLDKTPNTAARRLCRRRNLSFKIKVRPRSCRSYPIWRPCTYFNSVRAKHKVVLLVVSGFASKSSALAFESAW